MPTWGWGTGDWWARAAFLIGVAALLAVLGASCQPAGPEPAASRAEETEQVESPAAEPQIVLMNEFSFAPEAPPPPPGYPAPTFEPLPAGSPVLVTLRNDGHIVHEWRVGRTLHPGGGYEDDLLAMMEPEVMSGTGYRVLEPEEGAGEPGGVSIEVAPGAAVTLRLTVPANAIGTWEMGCFITGHYQAGMKEGLLVE